MREITKEYIDLTIEKLDELKIDFYEYHNFSDRYNRYLNKFEKAKTLIAFSNDISTLYPLEDPRELIYKYAIKLNKEEKIKFLKKYNRNQLNENILWHFENLDREENWQPFES